MNEKKIHEHRQSSRCLVYGTRCPDEQAEAAVDATLTKYIRSLVPPERLLVVNMTAGLEWSPLARFLQRPLPTTSRRQRPRALRLLSQPTLSLIRRPPQLEQRSAARVHALAPRSDSAVRRHQRR